MTGNWCSKCNGWLEPGTGTICFNCEFSNRGKAMKRLLKLASDIVICPNDQDPNKVLEDLPKTTPVKVRRLLSGLLLDVDVTRKWLASELRQIYDDLKDEE